MCYCPLLDLSKPICMCNMFLGLSFLNFEFDFYPEETMHGMLLLTGILTTLVSYWFCYSSLTLILVEHLGLVAVYA